MEILVSPVLTNKFAAECDHVDHNFRIAVFKLGCRWVTSFLGIEGEELWQRFVSLENKDGNINKILHVTVNDNGKICDFITIDPSDPSEGNWR